MSIFYSLLSKAYGTWIFGDNMYAFPNTKTTRGSEENLKSKTSLDTMSDEGSNGIHKVLCNCKSETNPSFPIS